MMAAKIQKPRSPQIFTCDIDFDGILQTSVKAKLIHELLKYLVYHRQQIPMPFEQLKQETAMVSKNSPEETKGRKRPNVRHKLEHKKRVAAIEGLDNLSYSFNQVLLQGHAIKEVLLVFGSTIVSPKEIYHITLPTGVYDGHILNFKSANLTLFKALVESDLLGDAKDFKSASKIMMLVKAPRESDFGSLKLIPKPMYKIPIRGTHFALNFLNGGKIVNEELSRVGDTEFEISGIEPLDDSTVEFCHSRRSIDSMMSYENSVCSTYRKSLGGISSQSLIDENHFCDVFGDGGKKLDSPEPPGGQQRNDLDNDGLDYIWYLIPDIVTGYKEKMKK